ncbi:hypothetical protein Mgra_00005461 [Meloidogyne graminicola]|uniref:Amino acid transporter transmembrane domain-containing protein n=1 Tax=Meloidogyne graminicola TaxID=189291 RepID=A0A8S9ZPG8_9BILA|nr:hypothetical protein Mgra_00005461 [Meloidogyne graminicola]
MIMDNNNYEENSQQQKYFNNKIMKSRRDGLSSHLTLINFMKGMIGSGILTLPIVFKQSGLWTGFLLVFIFGFLNTLTMKLLVKSAHYLAKKRHFNEKNIEGIQKEENTEISENRENILKNKKYFNDNEPMNYGEVMEAAFEESNFNWSKKLAKPSKFFVNGTIILLQIGIGCIKYDFIVAHLRELFGHFTNFHTSALTWAFLIFPPMVLLNFTRTLQRIAILNSIGNFFMFGAYGIIFYHLIQSPHKTIQLPWIGSPVGVLTACGSILYCFEGQAMVLPMENKMKHPSEMLGPFGVISTGMALTAIFDSAVGFLGYLKFGNEIQGSVTLNLPPTSLLTFVKIVKKKKKILIFNLIIFYVFTIISFLDFLLQQYVTIQMLWPPISKRISSKLLSSSLMLRIWEYIFRASLVAITMLISIFVPHLEHIMPLVGFSGGVFLAFIFPPIIDTFTFLSMGLSEYFEENNNERNLSNIYKRLALNFFFVAIGLFGSIAGLKSSLEAIFELNKK